MRSRLSTEHLARICARHRWATVGVWLGVFVLAIGLTATLLGDALSTDSTFTNNPESVRADAVLEERLGEASATTGEIVVVRSATLTVDDPTYRSYVEGLYGALIGLGDEAIAGGTHFYLTGDESLVSADRRTTLLPLTMPDGATDAVPLVRETVEMAESGANGAFPTLLTGEATLEAETTAVAEADLAKGEGIGMAVAMVVLALVFGAVAAAILPMVVAIGAIVVALGATALVGLAFDLPFFVINIMTMLGLAVGIDYSLLIVSRYREERTNGLEPADAIAAAGATAGRAVLISGLTVGLALTGLLITPDSGNQMIGVGGLLVVAAAVAASMTLLPALLGLMGDRVNALRIPSLRRRATSRTAGDGGFWSWTSRAVMRRPVVSLVLAGGALLALASFSFELNQGNVGVGSLPDGMESKDAFVVLQDEFGFGQDLPAVVVIDGETDRADLAAGVARLEEAIAADSAFVSSAVEAHPDANITVVRAWLAGDPSSDQAMGAVERLRAEIIPGAFAGTPAEALVTGETAGFVDLVEVNATYSPIVVAFVLGLSFLLLMVAFRSIVIPVKAILMNLLSVGATYGLLVLVFQKGVGAELLGFEQVEAIQVGLPLFMFAILFGLSMDYHVFLLSRIRERFLETGDNGEAVAYGLRSTGRLITGAALIMVAVFGGFALGDLVGMQQVGFGLATAVLIDATIVRCVLVPASMRLLGEWNWYLPRALRWLPTLEMEGPASRGPAPVKVAGGVPGLGEGMAD